ncbi:hypothetical protein, partial [Nocardia sp. NPDC051570]|uniref:hypothetical protein n=1 Tax=Nocardia sp. NPDC051570 TaxID=3364324 RepID=UPI0037887016
MPPTTVGVTKEQLRAKLEEALQRFPDGEALSVDTSTVAAGANPLMPTEAERLAAANGHNDSGAADDEPTPVEPIPQSPV